MSMDELAAYVRSLKEGGHVCLVFEDQDRKWDLEAEYVRRGLDQGYRADVATMKNDMEEGRRALIKRGIDVDEWTRKGCLVMEALTPEDAKSPNFLSQFSLESSKATANELLKSGKKGLYVASNINTFFLRHGLLDNLFMAESAVHRQMKNKLPFGYLCCYDVSDLSPSERPLALKELLEHYRRISEQNPQIMHSHNAAIYVSNEGGVLAKLPD